MTLVAPSSPQTSPPDADPPADAAHLDALPPEFAALFPDGLQDAGASASNGAGAALASDAAGASALHDQFMALFSSSAGGDSAALFPSDDPGAQTDEDLDEDMGEQSPVSATITPQDGLLVACERADDKELQYAQITSGATCVAVHAASVVLGRGPVAPTLHVASALIDLGPVPFISRNHATIDLQVHPPCIRVHGKHGLRINGRPCEAGESISLGYRSVSTIQILNQCLELHIPSDANAPGLQHPDPMHGLLMGSDHAPTLDLSSGLSPSAARTLVQAAAAMGAGAPTRKRKGSPGSDDSELGYGVTASNDSDDGDLADVETARQFLHNAAAAAAAAGLPLSFGAPSPAAGQGQGPCMDPVERRMSILGLEALGAHVHDSDPFQIFPASSVSPNPNPAPSPLPATAEEPAPAQERSEPVANPSPSAARSEQAQGPKGTDTSLPTASAPACAQASRTDPEKLEDACPSPPPAVPEPPPVKQAGSSQVPPPPAAVPEPPPVVPEPPPAADASTAPSPRAPSVPPPPSAPSCPSPQPAVPPPPPQSGHQPRDDKARDKSPASSARVVTDLTEAPSPKTSPSVSAAAKGKSTSKSTPVPPPSNPAALAYYHAIHGASASPATSVPASTGQYNPAALGYPPGFPPLGPLGMPGVLPGMLPGLYPGGASSFMSPFSPGYSGMSPFGMVPPMFPYPPPPATGSGSHASPTPEKADKRSPATRTSPVTSKGASQSPSTPSTSSSSGSGPPIRIIVAPAPPEADPAASLPGPIESLLDGPPIVHHGGALYLHPDVFGTLSTSEVRSLERAGIQEALQRLQSTLVVFLRARLKARKAQAPSTPNSPFRSRSSKRHARTGADGSPAPSPAGSRAGSPIHRIASRHASPSRSTLRPKSTTTPLANPPAVTSPLASSEAPLPAAPAENGGAPPAAKDGANGEGELLGEALALDFGQYDDLAFPDPPSLDS